MGKLVRFSGLRKQEFTHLTICEVPSLPRHPTPVPVLFPVGHAITKGKKARTSWIHYDVLAEVHQYIELDRAASAEGYKWRPPAKLGPPLLVEEPDWEGAILNGERRPWRHLTPQERLRLVTLEGQSLLVGLQSTPRGRSTGRMDIHKCSAVKAGIGQITRIWASCQHSSGAGARGGFAVTAERAGWSAFG
ncbi:hypothetical protein ABZ383_21230 [Streptomyces sp. NPDC005900]|uniref:hypothetical protein n=1 Tax=Streptomyces sp. NPDC005900 TaxID=3154569 RepID=UPI0033DDC2F3